MGCCQPIEQITYDYSSEAVLKSYHLNSSPHYRESSIKSPHNANNPFIDTTFKSPKKEIRLIEFQTPTERNTRKRQWTSEEIDMKNLILAFKNEDLKYLFGYIENEDFIEEIVCNIEHKWASYPKTIGNLACVLICNILNSYLNEEINSELLKEIKNTIENILQEQSFFGVLGFFKGQIDRKRFFTLEHGFLMINSLLGFLGEDHNKEMDFLMKVLIEFIIAFNGGFKGRKIEMALLIFDIFLKIHEKNMFSSQILDNSLNILRTSWLVFEISIELYSFDEQLFIWFRISNFLDEISKKHEKRLKNIEFQFKEGNIKDLLISMKSRLLTERAKFEKIKESQAKIMKFLMNLLEYIVFLILDLDL